MQAETRSQFIKFQGDTITIGTKGDMVTADKIRSLRLSDLTGVEFEAATVIRPGFIQPIHAASKRSEKIVFELKDQPAFRTIYDALMQSFAGESYTPIDHTETDRAALAQQQSNQSIVRWLYGFVAVVALLAFLNRCAQ